MSPTIRHKYKYFHSTVQGAKGGWQKFHFCRLPFDVRPGNVKLNLSNSHHLGQKFAGIFVLEHYLFLVAHSFPRALLSENCSLLRTDNVRGQISEHIFALNGDYYLHSHLVEGY